MICCGRLLEVGIATSNLTFKQPIHSSCMEELKFCMFSCMGCSGELANFQTKDTIKFHCFMNLYSAIWIRSLNSSCINAISSLWTRVFGVERKISVNLFLPNSYFSFGDGLSYRLPVAVSCKHPPIMKDCPLPLHFVCLDNYEMLVQPKPNY